MGTVFLARAEGPAGFEKLVALKRIHPHMASDRRFISMFLDEARIAARIQHPNCCSVIDFGEVGGNYYLTMPYIAGESLNTLLRTASVLHHGPVYDLLPFVGARLIADACEGLHAAHELRDDQGRALEVVHRDVSPQNLMVGYDGVVRVLDFGVASARHRHYQTSTGEVKGKFAYLAPEQIEAQPVDRRADVWSLGVVLWEAITAHRLFARPTMAATVRAVSDMPIPALRDVRPGVPDVLQAVVDRALARDPAERYPTARAMGKDLLAALGAEGRFLASGDVAEWMEQLFPDGKRMHEDLLENTRTAESLEPPPPPVDDPLHQSTVQRRLPPATEETTDRGERRSRALPYAIIAIVTVLALAAGSALAVWIANMPNETETIVVRPERRQLPVEPARPALPPDPVGQVAEQIDEVVVEVDNTLAQLDNGSETDNLQPSLDNVPSEPAEEPPVDPGLGAPAQQDNSPTSVPITRPPRAGRPGTLTVATPGGWALVFLGNRRLGEAPGVFSVPAGTHTIYLQPFGTGPRMRRRVVVPEGGTARISVPLRGP
jgi:eukaryotic-like serine/threonine-protein kinase